MSLPERPLEGMRVAISISESEHEKDLGSNSDNVNRLTLTLAEMLLGAGATVVFGHNWRSSGVMSAIHRAAISYRDESPPIRNFLPWPDRPGLSEAEQAEAQASIRIDSVGLPDELRHFEHEPIDRRPNTWLRARALTYMRRRLTTFADALICLGGRTRTSQGRYPGVVEEAYLMTQLQKPVFLSALLGGASRDLVHILERHTDLDECLSRVSNTTDAVKQAFAQQKGDSPDAEIDGDRLRKHFANELSPERLAERSGLSIEDYRSLLHASAIQQLTALLLRGLQVVKPNR